jgi:diguanylate cyclase (GGDEF)-like protein
MHPASQPGPPPTHENERRCALFFESALEGFAYCRMLYDEEGRPDDFVYLAVNPAFERLTGLKNIVGKRLAEVVPPLGDETPDVLRTYARVVETGEPAEFDIDVAPLGLRLHASARRPEPGHFIIVFTDVTERKRAEVEIRRLNHELEGRVVNRTAELKASNKENDELVNEAATLLEDNAVITRIAATDVLTGLSNRRHFQEALKKSVSFARRHRTALSVVSFDLDGLKAVNDAAGHEAGDEVLARFAALLAALCRAEDLPARLGGDEFSVLLPGIELGGARGFAERALTAVRSCAELAERSVTASAGIAAWQVDESPNNLLRRADGALYAAKRTGGDSAAAHD